jgi:lysozyme
MATSLKTLIDRIALDELSDADRAKHVIAGRHHLYKCPAGKLTIGYGRNLEANGISDTEARELLCNDVLQAQRDAASLLTSWFALDNVRRNVVANMAFNMGKATLATFVHFLNAVDEQRWDDASAEMVNSLWYGQVGHRAERLAQEMLTGEIA